MRLKKIYLTNFVLSYSLSFAAENQESIVPHLNLFSVDSSSIPTPPVTARTKAEHEKAYSVFYQLLESEQFVEELHDAVKQGSLGSTLFRPNENGNGIDLFFAVINDVIRERSNVKVSFFTQKDIVNRLHTVWETLECASTVFIAKAIKTVAKIIDEARSGQTERYVHASSYIDGTLKNLLSFIEFLERYNDFIGGLMRSQKEIYLLLASKRTLKPSELNRLSSTPNKISQCDFSVERLLRNFREQVSQIYLLRNLLPQVQVEAEKLLLELRGGIPSRWDKDDTSKTRGRSASVVDNRSGYDFYADSPRSSSSMPQNIMPNTQTSPLTSPRTNDLTSPRYGALNVSSQPTSPRIGISSPSKTRERSKTREIIMFSPSNSGE